MQLSVKALAGGADTAEQGRLVFDQIKDRLSAGENLTVDFDGVRTATSSFVNAAFVPLLAHLPVEQLKRQLRVTRSSRQINDMIKMRLEKPSQPAAA
jgi:hypothetical protein